MIEKTKNFIKKFIWVIVVLAIIIGVYFFTSQSKNPINVYTASRIDLKQTILATGQVTSQTDLKLSFPVSGVVDTLHVAVGDRVVRGQVLATLVNRSQYAALSDAKANYQKVIGGASSEEVAVAQASLDSANANLENTKKVQTTLVQNAYHSLLSVDLTPVLTSGIEAAGPIVSGTYVGSDPGSYTITPYSNGGNGYFSWDGLEKGTNNINTTAPVELGTLGLFVQFPKNLSLNGGNVWTINLPNTKSPNYLTAYNAYQSAIKNRDSAVSVAQASINEAQANLDLKKSSARTADVAVAQAKIDQAQADYDNTIIYAPASGTIAHVDTKVGESVDPKTETIVLQDVDNLYVEANVNETSIAKVSLGQPVSMTLDAFGLDTNFSGKVIHIDPSSTTNNGIVNYVIKTSIVDDSGKYKVRPGMNANMIITAWDHPKVIAIPKIAVTKKDDGSYVNIVIDDKDGKYESRKVETGLVGDGNLIEITSGLSGGEEIAITQ